jgi:ribonucleoside-diphosphate reductase alpha chain
MVSASFHLKILGFLEHTFIGVQMTRKRMPDRRKSCTQKVKISGQTFYLTFGYYEDGSIGEIFIEAHKEGTFVRGVLQALARSVSLMLQNGIPIADIVKMYRKMNFPPNGEVTGSDVKICSSVPDWIAQELENEQERIIESLGPPLRE